MFYKIDTVLRAKYKSRCTLSCKWYFSVINSISCFSPIFHLSAWYQSTSVKWTPCIWIAYSIYCYFLFVHLLTPKVNSHFYRSLFIYHFLEIIFSSVFIYCRAIVSKYVSLISVFNMIFTAWTTNVVFIQINVFLIIDFFKIILKSMNYWFFVAQTWQLYLLISLVSYNFHVSVNFRFITIFLHCMPTP